MAMPPQQFAALPGGAVFQVSAPGALPVGVVSKVHSALPVAMSKPYTSRSKPGTTMTFPHTAAPAVLPAGSATAPCSPKASTRAPLCASSAISLRPPGRYRRGATVPSPGQ